jgi:hypothetical protein
MWLCSSSTSIIEDRDLSAHLNILTIGLVDALAEQQNAGGIRRDDPVLMARFVWALVHGTAMLFIDGQLAKTVQRESLEHYVFERLYASIR